MFTYLLGSLSRFREIILKEIEEVNRIFKSKKIMGGLTNELLKSYMKNSALPHEKERLREIGAEIFNSAKEVRDEIHELYDSVKSEKDRHTQEVKQLLIKLGIVELVKEHSAIFS